MSLEFGKPDKVAEQQAVEQFIKSLFWRRVWLCITYVFLKSSRTELSKSRHATSEESVKNAQEALQKYIASRRNLRRDRKEVAVTVNLDTKKDV